MRRGGGRWCAREQRERHIFPDSLDIGCRHVGVDNWNLAAHCFEQGSRIGRRADDQSEPGRQFGTKDDGDWRFAKRAIFSGGHNSNHKVFRFLASQDDGFANGINPWPEMFCQFLIYDESGRRALAFALSKIATPQERNAEGLKIIRRHAKHIDLQVVLFDVCMGSFNSGRLLA